MHDFLEQRNLLVFVAYFGGSSIFIPSFVVLWRCSLNHQTTKKRDINLDHVQKSISGHCLGSVARYDVFGRYPAGSGQNGGWTNMRYVNTWDRSCAAKRSPQKWRWTSATWQNKAQNWPFSMLHPTFLFWKTYPWSLWFWHLKLNIV